MVRIINYKVRKREDATFFYVLEIQGGVEMVKSKETGNFYATVKKANVPSTFDEETCKALIGSEMPGKIIKEECEPYDYVVKETGEEIILYHRWVYAPEDEPETVNRKPSTAIKSIKADADVFSQNGVLVH
jgi:hypothetical protein